jgi:hypothetical protein
VDRGALAPVWCIVGLICRGRPLFIRVPCVAAALLFAAAAGCDSPHTTATIDNQYPSGSAPELVVFTAFWQSARFSTPIPPGSASDPQNTPSASENTAYVVLAPGWDPSSASLPLSFVVLQSKAGFAVHIGEALVIPVDDTGFAGRCAVGSFLTQDQADFMTQRVFADTFAGLHYDASTCTTVAAP